jgi:hypothetical protein
LEEKTRNADSSELIIFTGDLNVNGRSESPIVEEYRQQMVKHPEYKSVVASLDHEYERML